MCGIMFHCFHDNDRHPKVQGSIDENQLYKIIKYIGKNNIITPQEYMKNPCNNDKFCLTFDDNLKSQFDVAIPVLNDLNIKAFWFLNTCVYDGIYLDFEIHRMFRNLYFDNMDQFEEKFFDIFLTIFSEDYKKFFDTYDFNNYLKEFEFYTYNDRKFRCIRDIILSKDEYNSLIASMMNLYNVNVKDIANNLWMSCNDVLCLSNDMHVIGLHSYSHPSRMEDLVYNVQKEEYSKNYESILKILGFDNKINSMSHPCNSYNNDTLDILDLLEIEIGFRANMCKRDNYSIYEVPREDHMNIIREIEK